MSEQEKVRHLTQSEIRALGIPIGKACTDPKCPHPFCEGPGDYRHMKELGFTGRS